MSVMPSILHPPHSLIAQLISTPPPPLPPSCFPVGNTRGCSESLHYPCLHMESLHNPSETLLRKHWRAPCGGGYSADSELQHSWNHYGTSKDLNRTHPLAVSTTLVFLFLFLFLVLCLFWPRISVHAICCFGLSRSVSTCSVVLT